MHKYDKNPHEWTLPYTRLLRTSQLSQYCSTLEWISGKWEQFSSWPNMNEEEKISSQCTTKNLLMVRKYCFISLWIFIITFAPNQFMAANLSFPILFSLCSRFYVCFSAYSENLNFIQRRYCVEQNEEMKIVIWSRRKREEDEKSATKWEMRTRQNES